MEYPKSRSPKPILPKIPTQWMRATVKHKINKAVRPNTFRMDSNFLTIGVDWRDYPFIGFDRNGILLCVSRTIGGLLKMHPSYVWVRKNIAQDMKVEAYPVITTYI